MAVIGARPATGLDWLGGALRPRTRSRPAPRTRRVARRRREATSVSGLLATIAAASGLALFYLSQSGHVAATGYLIEDLHDRLAAVQAEQQRLTWEIARAQSPAVIEDRGREMLELVRIDQRLIRFATPPTDVATPSIDATR
jgi:hypothetical protein